MNIPAEIDLVYDERLYQAGMLYYHKLSLSGGSYLTIGPSNSGKTVLNKLIIGRYASYASVPHARCYIGDGKAFDYRFLRGVPNARYGEYLGVGDILTAFFSEFERRLKGQTDDLYPMLLLLEEWPSYMKILEETDKKAAKTAMAQVFSIVSQGRAYNVKALISCQRPDSAFTGGFRESLTSVFALGRISSETAKMVGLNEFPNFSGISGGQGVGWMLSENGEIARIRVPYISNFQKLHDAIIDVVTR